MKNYVRQSYTSLAVPCSFMPLPTTTTTNTTLPLCIIVFVYISICFCGCFKHIHSSSGALHSFPRPFNPRLCCGVYYMGQRYRVLLLARRHNSENVRFVSFSTLLERGAFAVKLCNISNTTVGNRQSEKRKQEIISQQIPQMRLLFCRFCPKIIFAKSGVCAKKKVFERSFIY